mgnify:FL=1|tara:strand:- start:2636 stop:3892 length:1257 start_codon:yes stop_codon:yes gene_type:complete
MDKDVLKEILSVLVQNPMRTILSMIGVAWGIFMLVIMMAASSGLENGVKSDIGNRAVNSGGVWSMMTSIPYKGFKKGRRFGMDMDDIQFLEENIQEIDVISPRCQAGGWQGGNNASYDNNTGSFNIYGETPGLVKIQPMNITQGRFINAADIKEERKVCSIGKKVFTTLFVKGENPIGKYIQINNVNVQVIGVIASMKEGDDSAEENESIFMPITAFQRTFNYGKTIGWFSVKSVDGYPISKLQEEIKAKLKIRKSVHPADQRAFGSWNMEEELADVNTLFASLKFISFSVGILALFAGIIGIGNIMLVSVTERTKEIGIRRALGAAPSVIIKQIISETLLITIVAGLLGIFFGVLVVELLNNALAGMGDSGSFRNPTVSFNVVFGSFLILIVAGVFTGLLPAYSAVRVKPIDALRKE